MNEKEQYVKGWHKFYSKQSNMIIAMFTTLIISVLLNESSLIALSILPFVTLVFPALYCFACRNIELTKRIEELEQNLSKNKEETKLEHG